MKLKYSLFLFVSLSFLFVTPYHSHGLSSVDWEITKTLKLENPPVDIAVTLSGRWIFVLTDPQTILLYSKDGSLNDTINLEQPVDQIDVGPREEILFLSNRKDRSVQVLSLTFIQDIDVTRSPFKGPEKAPVVIAVFSDFE
ncbi:MAG: hypothetical protein JRI85_04420 [Deltaproteobacteria bacterium]|nr:hypothetical protein [Deltaproteobacteria bacterium]